MTKWYRTGRYEKECQEWEKANPDYRPGTEGLVIKLKVYANREWESMIWYNHVTGEIG